MLVRSNELENILDGCDRAREGQPPKPRELQLGLKPDHMIPEEKGGAEPLPPDDASTIPPDLEPEPPRSPPPPLTDEEKEEEERKRREKELKRKRRRDKEIDDEAELVPEPEKEKPKKPEKKKKPKTAVSFDEQTELTDEQMRKQLADVSDIMQSEPRWMACTFRWLQFLNWLIEAEARCLL